MLRAGEVEDGSTVRYHVLGRVGVEVAGTEHLIRRRREGLILSLLVAAQGAPVSADRLVAQAWGVEPPPRALASLQVAVSRLRTLVEPGRAPREGARRIVSTVGGYALRARSADVDAWDFAARAAEALRAAPVDRLAAAEAALAAWEGAPYPEGSDIEPLRLETVRLSELWVAVQEARAEALLALGRHDEVVRALADLAPEHPFRERLWGQLALAQYRAGRQAEALATLRTLRTRLVDELGVDPSTPSRDLESSILAQDAALAAPATSHDPPRGTPVPAAPPAHADPGLTPDQVSKPPAQSAGASGSDLLVGRETALESVDAFLARLLDRPAGGLLLISGEAGIGKTHLVHELAVRAAGRGMRVLLGRTHEADVAPAYWPWLPALREIAGPDAGPELARLLGGPSHANPAPDGGTSALRTYDAVCRALTAAAAPTPLVVILEDIQWADTSSLRLLAYAAQALEHSNVALVVTRRTPAGPPSEPLTAALAALARHGVARVVLEGLSGPPVAALLRERVGDHDPSLAAVLSRRTGGNPFYLIEMALLLAARGTTDPAEAAVLPVPDGVRDVIRLRLDRMPPAALGVLRHAATLGRNIDADCVAATTGLDLAEVLDQLDLCVASGLVVTDGARYEFAHALTRESVYDEVPAGRRLLIHAAVARALGPRAESDADLIPEIAHHAWLAASLGPGYAAEAIGPMLRAAEQAESRSALPEAAVTWHRLQRVADGLPLLDAEVRFRIDLGAGRADLRLGNAAPARAAIDAAIASGKTLRRWDLVATAATSFAAAGSWSWREFGSTDQTMIDTLRACLDHLPDGPLAAMVLACLQMEHYYAAQSDEGESFGRRSVEMARRTGDATVVLQVLLLRALAAWGHLTAAERVELGEEIVRLPMEGESEVLGLWHYGGALHQAGRPAEADAVMARCFAAARRLRHSGSDIPIAWWRFMRAVEQDLPEAAVLGESALDLHRRTGYPSMHELVGVHAVRTAGRGAAVADSIREAARTSTNAGFRAIVAHALLEAGEGETAREVLGAPPDPRERTYATRAARCLRLAVLAEVGTVDEVRSAMSQVAPWSGGLVAFGTVDALGAVDYFLALGSTAIGDLDTARRQVAAAVRLDRAVGNLPWGRRAADLAARLADRRP